MPRAAQRGVIAKEVDDETGKPYVTTADFKVEIYAIFVPSKKAYV